MALMMSLNERFPFLGLAILAWFSPQLGVQWSLILTFILLIWQGFGGGFTATAWQSLIAKIMPLNLYGRFFGIQSAAVTLTMAIAAILAGYVLSANYYPLDFTLCFLLASLMMALSFFFLALTKEEESPLPAPSSQDQANFREGLRSILSITLASSLIPFRFIWLQSRDSRLLANFAAGILVPSGNTTSRRIVNSLCCSVHSRL